MEDPPPGAGGGIPLGGGCRTASLDHIYIYMQSYAKIHMYIYIYNGVWREGMKRQETENWTQEGCHGECRYLFKDSGIYTVNEP